MKEIKILFVLLILFSTSVFAEPVENYNDVQYLEMDLKISSDLDINYAGSNSDVEFFKGDLSFFPKNDLRQIVQNFFLIFL